MKIFISHSFEDIAFVAKLKEDIPKPFELVWSTSDIKPGDYWINEIKYTMESADIIIVVLSKSSIKSSAVNSEIAFAMSEYYNKSNKIIIPILKDKNIELPFFIQNFQYLDLSSPGIYRNNIEKLKQIISEIAHAQESNYNNNHFSVENLNKQFEIVDSERKMLQKEVELYKKKKYTSFISLTIGVASTILASLTITLSLNSVLFIEKFSQYKGYFFSFLLGVGVSFIGPLIYEIVKKKVSFNKDREGVDNE